MKLATRLKIFFLTPIVLVSFSLMLIVVQNDKNNKLENERTVADTLVLHAFELHHILSDFMLDHSEEVFDEWMDKHKEIGAFLSKTAVLPENEEDFSRIFAIFVKLRQLFVDQNWQQMSSKIAGYKEISADKGRFENIFTLTHELVDESLAYSKKISHKIETEKNKINIFIVSAFLLLAFLLSSLSFFLTRRIIHSVTTLKKSSNIIATGNLDYRAEDLGSDEFGELAESLNQMSEKLNQEITRRREKEVELLNQTKTVQMGEMITNITHHWRQPLNVIGLNVQEIKDAKTYGELDGEYLNNIVEKTMKKLKSMSETLDRFRKFAVNRDMVSRFDLSATVDKVLELIRPSLESLFIEVELNSEPNIFILGNENSMMQVLYNIFLNAEEALKENNIKNRKIFIKLAETPDQITLTIEDSAGGINEDIILRIFDPFFTTKGNHNKTGTGLYFARSTIESEFDGTLSVENGLNGAKFTILIEATKKDEE